MKATTQRKIDALKASMPVKPLRDVVATAQLAHERIQIAELYLSVGEIEAATEWYREAAVFCRDSGAGLAAVALVKKALRLKPRNSESLALYAELWRSCELGDPPEPVT